MIQSKIDKYEEYLKIYFIPKKRLSFDQRELNMLYRYGHRFWEEVMIKGSHITEEDRKYYKRITGKNI